MVLFPCHGVDRQARWGGGGRHLWHLCPIIFSDDSSCHVDDTQLFRPEDPRSQHNLWHIYTNEGMAPSPSKPLQRLNSSSSWPVNDIILIRITSSSLTSTLTLTLLVQTIVLFSDSSLQAQWYSDRWSSNCTDDPWPPESNLLTIVNSVYREQDNLSVFD